MDKTYSIAHKQLELDALLEITQAINENLPESDLFKIFKFTLLGNLNIPSFLLLVREDEKWVTKVKIGFEGDNVSNKIPEYIFDIHDLTYVNDPSLQALNIHSVFPVWHKNQLLAFGMLGSILEYSHELSILKDRTTFLRALTNILIVAIENKRLARQQLEQIKYKQEMEIARQVQNFLFPEFLPNNQSISVSAYYQPHAQLGGDYYDWIEVTTYQSIFVIADVSGKGVPAALMMSNVQASLRILANQSLSLKEIVHRINTQVATSGNKEIFITLFLGMIDFQTAQLIYVNCGHHPPILIQNESDIVTLQNGTTVLGIFDQLPNIEIGTITIKANSRLFLFTDGLTETFNNEHQMFGEESVVKYLLTHRQVSSNFLLQSLMDELNNFRKKEDFHDDITMMTIDFMP